jgi:hypothetical protein
LIQKALVEFALRYQSRGIAMVAINSNDVESYPADAPGKMTEFARENQFGFPYLYDEDQSVAKAYHAACTPDFFLFDASNKLVYRGQFDGARPGNGVEPNGEALELTCDAMLSGEPVLAEQVPSMGCNIKWKPGEAPDYYG